jgi:phenylalanyl-tRNA synthetase beta chain
MTCHRRPVLFELDWDAVLQRPLPAFIPVSKFQVAERDVAVIVKDSVDHDDLMAAIARAVPQALLLDVTVFDVFRPDFKAQKKRPGWLPTRKAWPFVAIAQHGCGPDRRADREFARQAVVQQLVADTGARLRA